MMMIIKAKQRTPAYRRAPRELRGIFLKEETITCDHPFMLYL